MTSVRSAPRPTFSRVVLHAVWLVGGGWNDCTCAPADARMISCLIGQDPAQTGPHVGYDLPANNTYNGAPGCSGRRQFVTHPRGPSWAADCEFSGPSGTSGSVSFCDRGSHPAWARWSRICGVKLRQQLSKPASALNGHVGGPAGTRAVDVSPAIGGFFARDTQAPTRAVSPLPRRRQLHPHGEYMFQGRLSPVASSDGDERAAFWCGAVASLSWVLWSGIGELGSVALQLRSASLGGDTGGELSRHAWYPTVARRVRKRDRALLLLATLPAVKQSGLRIARRTKTPLPTMAMPTPTPQRATFRPAELVRTATTIPIRTRASEKLPNKG
jgi:hypothetical protein